MPCRYGVVKADVQRPTRKAKVRKTFAVIGIVLGLLLLVFGGIVGLLHVKGVQTFIVGIVTDKLSETLQVDAQMQKFRMLKVRAI